MTISRRNFLKAAGTAGGVLLAGGAASARGAQAPETSAGGIEFNGMLIDTTKCIGCRACEEACNEANQLPKPKVSFSDESVFEETRDTTTGAYTVVNRFPNEKNPDAPIFVRKQCMHCNQPACASACLCRAMEKTKEAAVIYHKDRCMGCRYCMVACPFDIPKFEYNSATPFVWKCIFCNERQKKGEQPACSEVCPTGATLFGKKRDLLEIAKTRIYNGAGQVRPQDLRGARGRRDRLALPDGRSGGEARPEDQPADDALSRSSPPGSSTGCPWCSCCGRLSSSG